MRTVLFVSAVLGVIAASACAPSASADRTTAPPPATPATTPPAAEPPVAPSEVLVDAAAGAGGPDSGLTDPPDTDPGGAPAPDASSDGDAHPADTAGPPDAPRSDGSGVQDSGAPAPDLAPVIKRAAFLVPSPFDPQPGERRMQRRLEARGFSVQFMFETALPANVAGASLVLISASTRSSVVMDHMRDIPIGLIVMKASVLDDLGMTGVTRDADYGESAGLDLQIAGGGHALTAALSGTVRVADAALAMAWGRPGPAAARIAGLPGDPAKLGVFAYDKGAMMMARPAPARRIGFFATEPLAAQWTADAVRLFDAAVDWASR